ncbi:E3 ubiquitin-protein ligase Siah1 isoform X1 [Cryptotermes secundus]|uniref:E3 ubiquitin-protein ligase Siah1 isoform X1 n=1 Tax=Cryptotermes secundus TaxID=105785 RepID=UPI000CD7C609|nr:E3 ubiquitin-protein ligase Siah1 isoform X1 [Cryptotermes secundus]
MSGTKQVETGTPTNSPPNVSSAPQMPERSVSPDRVPNIKIFCENFQELLSKMVCPSCEEILTSPVQICVSGHSYCGKCLPLLTLCLICFKPLTKTQNRNVMKILSLASFNCPWNLIGCVAMMPLSAITEHYKYCHFMLLTCPASREKDTYCAWQGIKMNLPSHIKTHEHQQLSVAQPFLVDSCRVWPEKILRLFLLYEDEIFTYYRLVFEDTWYSMVHQVGLTRRKFESAFKLDGANGKDRIRMTVPVPVRDDESACSLFSGKCFRIPGNMIQHFIKHQYINLTIFLNDVTKSTNP